MKQRKEVVRELYSPSDPATKDILEKYAKATDKQTRTSLRNAYISRNLVRIMEYHMSVDDELFAREEDDALEEFTFGLGFDVYTLAFSTMAAAFTPVGTKTVMAALSAFTSGVKTSYADHQKNIQSLSERGLVLALLQQKREGVLEVVALNMKHGADVYSIDDARVDLLKFVAAGNLSSALGPNGGTNGKAPLPGVGSTPGSSSARSAGEGASVPDPATQPQTPDFTKQPVHPAPGG